MNELNKPEVPVTILTGFLGAGKTTLLKRILSEKHGHKIAVIENEFGEESIDNELLFNDGDERIVEMNNGCICCTVRDDLIEILGELKRKRESRKLSFERVIIETTGLADPGPVAQTFFMDDAVADYYILDGVVTVVDAVHGMAQLDNNVEAQAQVGFADRLLLSKVDVANPEEVAKLKHRLVMINPRAPIKEAHFGSIPIVEVLDIRGFNLNAVLEIDPHFLAAEDHQHEHHHEDDHGHACAHDHVHGPECSHHRHHHAHTDDISSFVFRSLRPFNPVLLEEFLGAIVQVYGPDLLRYKGVLNMLDVERQVVFQGVHMMMGADAGRLWKDGETRETKMVFIGKKLPRDTIVKGLEHCLAP